MNRCLNDIFGYCLRQPDAVDFDSFKVELDYRGKPISVPFTGTRCLQNHHICPDYQTFTQTPTERPIKQIPLSLA